MNISDCDVRILLVDSFEGSSRDGVNSNRSHHLSCIFITPCFIKATHSIEFRFQIRELCLT